MAILQRGQRRQAGHDGAATLPAARDGAARVPSPAPASRPYLRQREGWDLVFGRTGGWYYRRVR